MPLTMHEFGLHHEDTLLMIHPMGVQWDVYEYVIPRISERFHVIIPASRGWILNNRR